MQPAAGRRRDRRFDAARIAAIEALEVFKSVAPVLPIEIDDDDVPGIASAGSAHGHRVHQALIMSGSRVASRQPFGVNGCLLAAQGKTSSSWEA